MIRIVLSVLLGYFLGSLSPSAWIAKRKRKNLREHGTKNLGATNTALVLGKRFGVVVMIFDILKGFLAFWLAAWIAPEVEWLPLLTGACAVVGHCFPLYLGFRGGKGLAAFGGVVLAYNPLLFAFLLLTGVVLLVIANHSFILPFYAAVFFVSFVAIWPHHGFTLLAAILASAVIVIRHTPNLRQAIQGKDVKIRTYIKDKLFRKNSAD